jgi:flagellar motor switch protein FliM
MSDERDTETEAAPGDGTAEPQATAAPAPGDGEKLSQEEVQALLRGVEDGDVGNGDAAPPPGEVRPFDLVGEERLVGQRFHAIELAQDRFVRRLSQSLATFTGAPPEVTTGKPDMLRYGTFRNRLETPASLHLFTMGPLRGQGLVLLSPPLVFGLVDRFFGGPGRLPESLAGRASSAIELQVVQRAVTLALADLTAAWAPLHPVTFTLTRSETSLVSVALAAPSDLVLLLPVACDIGTGPAPLTIAIPFPALEPLKAKLGEPRAAVAAGPDGEWRRMVVAAVREAAVTVTAELGGRDVAARQVLAWRPGDVVSLDAAADDPLALCVEGIRLLSGVPGVSRGNNAVRILGREA